MVKSRNNKHRYIVIITFCVAAHFPVIAQEMTQEKSRSDSKKEIITLDYHIRSRAADAFTNDMIAYAKKQGGYLVSINRGRLVFRIPVKIGRKNIDKKIDSSAGSYIYRASYQNQDVSVRIIDLQAKLKASVTNLEKLRKLSATAGLDDLLDLETAMNNSLQKVDHLKGEISYLESSSDLYLVSIQINSIHVSSSADQVPIPWIRNLGLQGLTGAK